MIIDLKLTTTIDKVVDFNSNVITVQFLPYVINNLLKSLAQVLWDNCA
jgi:hypothetical protein